VLRLQSLDLEASARDAAAAGCETAMQSVLADLREAEAQIERIRADQSSKADALSAIQARFYEAGAEVTRIEQSIQYTRELRQRQRGDLEQVDSQAAELAGVVQLDRVRLESLSLELATMVPALESAHDRESTAVQALNGCEQGLAAWQQSWDSHAQVVAMRQRETQVERALIEQLDAEQRRLLQQRERQETERTALAQLQLPVALETLTERADAARMAGEKCASELQEVLAEMAVGREKEREQSDALNALRARLQHARGTLVSTEALQQAALGKAAGKITQWLKSQSLDRHPRVAQQLRVDKGWDRAVETVLGSYLEAVCVDGLDGVADLLASFDGGHLAMVSTPAGASTGEAPKAGSLQAKVQGTSVLQSVLSSVYTAESLAEALNLRRQLKAGESVVTRDGIWLGSDWLRVSRDADPHTGVIEREETLRQIRLQVGTLESDVRDLEQRFEQTRESVRDFEDRRERCQIEMNRLHRDHVDRRAELESAQARTDDAAKRLSRLETELADVRMELERSETELRAARGRMETAIDALAALEPERVELELQRDRQRVALNEARAAAAAAQQHARDLAVQVESRRSSHTALITTLARLDKQLEDLEARRVELATQLADSDAPLAEAQARLERELGRRAEVEAELKAARIASDELDALLHERDAARAAVDARLESSRSLLDEARLAAQQVRVRREGVAEQLVATNFEFAVLAAQIAADASVETWEAQLEDTKGKIERLGQVNLAAIGEFKEQSERKEYLDRQCKDLTDALETLESAMRKIDRETRTRFQDTFDRVNAGLKEKFPRLFGGGHAYLELAGDDSTAAGVSVMARPPGKRNSTISQLSGGEKALTAVALVFAIFDLNPAPFCLLDEVDAPLDENNVGRFCDIVRDMSRNVQFIFITHNKSTMELAEQLVGVTMNEPGVSRLVSVDVDEAVRMAAM
jgi:chromosome segregation protein